MRYAGMLLLFATTLYAAEVPQAPPPDLSLDTNEQSIFDFLKPQLYEGIQQQQGAAKALERLSKQARERLKLPDTYILDIDTGKFVVRQTTTTTLPEAPTGTMEPDNTVK